MALLQTDVGTWFEHFLTFDFEGPQDYRMSFNLTASNTTDTNNFDNFIEFV